MPKTAVANEDWLGLGADVRRFAAAFAVILTFFTIGLVSNFTKLRRVS